MSKIKKFNQECQDEIKKQGEDNHFWEATRKWMDMANSHKYSYHFTCLGRPLIQYPQDIVAMQEIIWKVKPDLIIETGIAHGGSLIMNASMLSIIDYCEAEENGETINPKEPKRRVLGIDIEIREHNRKAIESHPMYSRIDMIQGSSVAQEVIEKACSYAKGYQNVLVCLDSMHTHDHVLAELNAYAPLVSKGSYCIVFDTIIEDMPDDTFPDRPWSKGNNPKTAVWEYLRQLKEVDCRDVDGQSLNFEIDKMTENKLLITVAPDGFLKRV